MRRPGPTQGRRQCFWSEHAACRRPTVRGCCCLPRASRGHGPISRGHCPGSCSRLGWAAHRLCPGSPGLGSRPAARGASGRTQVLEGLRLLLVLARGCFQQLAPWASPSWLLPQNQQRRERLSTADIMVLRNRIGGVTPSHILLAVQGQGT